MGSYEDLKHVGFVKLIEVKFLVMFSNIYDFFKDNSRCLKKTVVSVENKVISIMEPVNKMITTICEYKLGFVDEKIEKYAPTFIKDLVGIINSCVKEKIAFVENVFGPLVHKAKTLLEYGFSTIESLLQKCINVKKSIFKQLVYRTEYILEQSLDFTKQALDKLKVVVGGIPIIGDATQTIITIRIDMFIQYIETTTISIREYGIFGSITSVVQHVLKETQETSASIFQKGFEYFHQALDTTKSVVGGIPIIGEVTQSMITKQIDIASQLIQTTTSSIKENGIIGTMTKSTEHVVNEAQAMGASIIQKGVESASQALDTTKSVVGGVPIIGNAVQSIITKQTDMASQLFENTTSSIKEKGIFGTMSSITENVVKEVQETSTSIIQKGSESVSQALETTKSVVGGIPIIGDTAQSIISKQTDLASQLVETTTSSIKEKGIFGTISSITENVVSEVQETSTSIIQKGYESASQVVETTKSVIGGIPIIGDTTQSIINKQTDMASKFIETTTSSIKENGILGAITSATGQVVKEAQATSSSIIQKGSESVTQAFDTTKSIMGGIPIIGDATQSIITKQTDTASQLFETATTSIKEKGVFGSITSAAEHVVKEAKDTSSSIIQKSTESASQALDTTKSIVGGFPIFGDAAQSIITKQTDIASQLINSTSSSYKENGIYGALTSAAEHVVKEAKETSSSIIQKSTESANQVFNSTKTVVGGFPIFGDAAQSIITKQTDMASQFINSTSSSYKENGIFGAITSAAEHVAREAKETSSSIIQKSTSSQFVNSTSSSYQQNGIFGAISSAAEHVAKEAKETSSSIIQKSTESASQVFDSTKSAVGGLPIFGNAAQFIITKQTDMASQLINSTSSSYKENGIFGAISSAAEHVAKEAKETSTSIIQKSTDSASQVLDTTKSVVGGLPIIGDAAQSIITKQTDMASELINTTSSSYKENGIFGAISAATNHVAKEAQATGESIIQKTSDSANQALETTKSVVGGIPIVGNAAQSIITKQTNMASGVIKRSTSSVKKHGLFGALIAVADHVVKDAEKTAKTIVKNGVESVHKTVHKKSIFSIL